TVIVWHNMVRLSIIYAFRHRYLGSQTEIGENVFAHGGGGITLPNSAMRKVVGYYQAHNPSIYN
ncbi:hypothetical protein EJ05DRAFT_446516, partial [Pseudovirgaria hyperparasitica]